MGIDIYGNSNSVDNVLSYGGYGLGGGGQNISSYALNSVGYIPILSGNSGNRSGFFASASSEYSGVFSAFKAFAYNISTNNNERATAGVSSNVWIQIQLPTAKRVWKFQLRPKQTTADPES